MMPSQVHLSFINSSLICVVRGVRNSFWFDYNNGNWVARHGAHYVLSQSGDSWILFDKATGIIQKFYDRVTFPVGALKSITLPNGTTSANFVYDWVGRLTSVSVASGSLSDSYSYIYNQSGGLSTIVFSGQSGSRCVQYSYYENDGANGRANDLQTVQIYDGSTTSPPLLRRTY